MNEDFYTFSTYIKNHNNRITASMEDYIEMIYRLSNGEGITRVSCLSQALNVQAPSTSKMMKKLSELGMVTYEPYGYIKLTDLGESYGTFLINRHNVIEKFLKILGVKESVLETTEKIEHLINNEVLYCIKNFNDFIKNNKIIEDNYKTYLINNKNNKKT